MHSSSCICGSIGNSYSSRGREIKCCRCCQWKKSWEQSAEQNKHQWQQIWRWCSQSIKWKEGDVVGLGCRAACRWACCSSLNSFPYLRLSSWVCWRISAEPGLSLAAAALSGSQMSFALCFTFLHDERCWMLNNVRSKREDVWSSQATAVEETGNAYSAAHVANRVRRQMFAQRRSYQKCKSIISQDWIIQLSFF